MSGAAGEGASLAIDNAALFEECYADFLTKLRESHLVRPTERLKKSGDLPIRTFDLTITTDEGKEGEHDFLKVPLMDVLSADESDRFCKHVENFLKQLSAPVKRSMYCLLSFLFADKKGGINQSSR